MDWEPRVGMKVVCVDAGPPPSGRSPKGLVKGRVYVIRSVGNHMFADGAMTAIRLQGYTRNSWDTPVGARRFKPLRERKTDISIFTALLTKAPTPEKEPA